MCKPTTLPAKTDSPSSAAAANPKNEPDHAYPPQKQTSKPNNNDASNQQLSLAQETLQKGTWLSCVALTLLITGMSLTFPHMQSQRDNLGCDSLCYGSMTSARGALGLIGTALVGRLSDKNGTMLAKTLGSFGKNVSSSGRRACLYLGTLASLIGLFIASSTNSLMGLWLSMIPGALLQHNFDVYKALLSEYHNDIEQIESNTGKKDDSEESNGQDKNQHNSSRSGSLGKIGMSVGISFMIGPMISTVAVTTFQSATHLAMFFTLASMIVIYELPLPIISSRAGSMPGKKTDVQYQNESHGKENKEKNVVKENGHSNLIQKKQQTTEFTFFNLIRLSTPKTRAAATLLILRWNMALAFHIFNTIWPTSLKTRFHFGPTDHAKFMSFVGVVYALSQGFVAKRIVHLVGTKGKVGVIMACCAILGFGRYIAYYTTSVGIVYVSFLFIINALGILNTVISADTGTIAPSDEIGALFGVLQASESAAGMVGPFLGGVVSHYSMEQDIISAPLLAVLVIYGFLFVFVFWGYERFVISCGSEDVKNASALSENKVVKKSM